MRDMENSKFIHKYRTICLIVVVFGFFLSLSFFFPDLLQKNENNTDERKDSPLEYNPLIHYQNISLTIDFNNGTIVENRNIIIPKNESSVLDLLESFFVIGYDTYTYGVIITSIANLANNVQENSFWFFWVNNEYASVGVTSVNLNDNFEIFWAYRNANDVAELS